MEPIKPKLEAAIRILMIAVVSMNAFAPAAVEARAGLEESRAGNSTEQATAVPSETAVPTEPPATDAPTEVPVTPSETAAPTSTPEPSATPAPTETPTQEPTAAPASAGNSPALRFEFSAAPGQAMPGEEVTFTVQITNTGNTDAGGFQFSNVLPDEFGNDQSGFKDFDFDPKTRRLVWGGQSKKGGESVLPAGESMTLQYTVRVDANVKEGMQIFDEAELFIDGSSASLTSSAALMILPAGKHFTSVGARGGKAEGLGGNVRIDVPPGLLNESEGILIENLRESQADPENPWLIFELGVWEQIPQAESQPEAAAASETVDEVQSAPAVPSSTLEPSVTPQPTEESKRDKPEGGKPEPQAGNPNAPSGDVEPSAEPSPTATIQATETAAAPAPVVTSREKDKVFSLKSREARFDKPVEITVSFDGILKLEEMDAEYSPYLVTQDEASGAWVHIPVDEVDRQANTFTAELDHFSIWGAGVGTTNIVTAFDNPYPELFTGSARYSIPIWTPPGRNGMAPSLSLSYSSATADGVFGDIQAPWVGMGWNIDTVEIARQILDGNCGSFCGSTSYGYRNNFVLLFNGTGYVLIPDGTTGRYHTKSESFLYIQLHNYKLGNQNDSQNNPPPNVSGEWWEVVQRDGTRWRLGWNRDSEQLAAMLGYTCTTGSPCVAPSGAYAPLGYAGIGGHVVAGRWRADRVTDTHDNTMTLAYFEEPTSQPSPACQECKYDRSSYLDTISYTGTSSGTLLPAYSVSFIRGSREQDQPAFDNNWDNSDYFRLDRIEVKYGLSVVRSYNLTYQTIWEKPTSPTYSTQVLKSVTVTGRDGTSAPPITFDYENKVNRAPCTGCKQWPYPRLVSISNGWGGSVAYTYGHDGRPYTTWYNWRVTEVSIDDGPYLSSPMKTTFAYATPCYKPSQTASADPTANWTCSGTNPGALVGYAQTTATTLDFDGGTILAKAVHSFYTDEKKAGREYQLLRQNGSSATLSQTSTTYTVVTAGLPTNGYFTYASQVQDTLGGIFAGLRTYEYDSATGNLTRENEYSSVSSLYRQTDYEYVTNSQLSFWILDTVSRRILKDAAGAPIAEQRYGYDGNAPGSAAPNKGAMTLSQQVNVTANQTVDTGYIYDAYGNLQETHKYKAYGVPGSLPTGNNYLTYSNGYGGVSDPLQTYVRSTSGPMPIIPAATMDYDYGLGLPTSVTDPNGNTTTTAYDGLGRVTQVTYAGYTQPNVKYTYPALPLSAPFAVKAEVWDETASIYRATWQIMDGLGRAIQTQEPYENPGEIVVTDTSYNAMGLVELSGQPRIFSGTGGDHQSPSWGTPYTRTSYDALGRVTSVVHPDASQEIISYYDPAYSSYLVAATIDRNNHKKLQVNDPFGRLTRVVEYSGDSPYYPYATTTYEYDPRDLLKKVTDAAGNQTTITYDGFGRKSSMTDPNMGAWSYGYDVFGNLTSQTDARGCVTAVTYDDLNRPIQKAYSGPGACDGTPDVTYTYDSTANDNESLGRRTGSSNNNASTSWVYNVLGQPTNQTQRVDGTDYSLNTAFDALGRPLTQNLPNGETLNYAYNAMGALSGLSGASAYLSQVRYSASGQAASQQLGNGLLQQFCYQTGTLRLAAVRAYPGSLQSCVVANPSNSRLNIAYDHQPNGNVDRVVDYTRNETIDYTYDGLDRLLNARGPYYQNFTYDSVGNLISTGYSSTQMTAVSVGGDHTCGLTTNGGIKCWGSNGFGQLGNGTNFRSLTPMDVTGLASGVVAVTTSLYYTCAVTTAGGAKCWGYNGYGQLGNGSTSDRNTPVDVYGLTTGVAAIAAGGSGNRGSHTCALTVEGGVKCWGSNSYGELGDGTIINRRTTPVEVVGLSSRVTAIAAGLNHTCALMESGAVKCWGRGGALGDGTTTQSSTPVDVVGLTGPAISIVASPGGYTCALMADGGVKCWGITPVDVSGLEGAPESIVVGAGHTCALMAGGGVKCWGNNAYGQLGDGTSATRTLPGDVNGLTSGVTAIAAGEFNSCAVTTGGKIKCWGNNDDGQLGDGTTSAAYSSPVNVGGLGMGVTAVAASISSISDTNFFTCALTTSGGVKCWGNNSSGQLGDGTTTDHITPLDVSGLTAGVSAITTGSGFACALMTNGAVKCWGSGGSTPVGVTGIDGVTNVATAISAGAAHACALMNTGAVMCWGNNYYGQLGNNSLTNSPVPVFVSGYTDDGSDAIAISAGTYHSCLVTNDNGVQCWGRNNNGQLGNGSGTDSKIPVPSGLTSGVTTISAGALHTCALISSGAVKCWGRGTVGQLGDGTTTGSATPVSVSGITNNAVAISAGDYHNCALLNSGGMKCWGQNGRDIGKLGDGSMVDKRTTPVSVIGLNSGVIAIEAGGGHTCAVLTGGSAKCWGNNESGEVGRDTSPVDVLFTAIPDKTYTYGDPAHKHAVTSLSTGETYTYDANGNMTQRVEGGKTYTQEFDAENRLVKVTVDGQTTQFFYDGDGNMVKQVDHDGSKTIYVGGVYEEARNSLNAVTRTVVYYPAGGAMRVTEGAASNVYYMLKDHLGSASVLTDSSGNIVDEQRYMPFGQPRLVNADLLTDRLFTGQRNLPSLGLMDYKARMYSPSLGRFIQPDTIVPNPMNPQSFNRYSYVVNNPIIFSDPTGYCYEGEQYDHFAICEPDDYDGTAWSYKSWSQGGSGTPTQTPASTTITPTLIYNPGCMSNISSCMAPPVCSVANPGLSCAAPPNSSTSTLLLQPPGSVPACSANMVLACTIPGIVTTIKTVTELDERLYSTTISIAVAAILLPFNIPAEATLIIAGATGYINYDLNHMPGFMEGDVVISGSYSDPYDTFSCYGYTINRTVSTTTISRDGKVIYSGVGGITKSV